MASNVTLASLRTQVRQQTHREGDDPTLGFVTDAELTQYINNSIGEFYNQLYTAFPEGVRKSSLITVANDNDTYDLPDDFKHLLGVEYQLTGAILGGQWLDIRRCIFSERNKYTLRPLVAVPGVVPFEYLIFNDSSGWKIQFVPFPFAGASVRVWYAPAYTKLAADGEELDGINGLEEFVIIDAAIKVLQKEETDPGPLLAMRQSMLESLREQGKQRDSNEPGHMGWNGAAIGWDGGTGWD